MQLSRRPGFLSCVVGLAFAVSLLLSAACTNDDGAGAEEPSATPALSAPAPQALSPNLTPAASSNRLDCGVLQSTGSRTDAERQFLTANCTTTAGDRTSCASISGTAYRSDAERDWYLANCVPTPAPPSDTPVTAQRPSPQSTPSASCSADVTITMDFDREYFPVTGLTVEAINASLQSSGPKTPEGLASGVTQYALSIDPYACVRANSCQLGRVSLKARGKVILPKHVAEARLGTDVAEVWARFVSDTTIHEERHVTIVKEGLEEAKRRLEALSPAAGCSNLDQAVDSVWQASRQAIDQRQESFHVADRFGVGGVIVP